MKKLFIAAPIFILFVIFLTTTGCPGPDPGGFEPPAGALYIPPGGWELKIPDDPTPPTPPTEPQCTTPRPPNQGCSIPCKPCFIFICENGEWVREAIEWPDGMCNPRPSSGDPVSVCPRGPGGQCPPECSWCF